MRRARGTVPGRKRVRINGRGPRSGRAPVYAATTLRQGNGPHSLSSKGPGSPAPRASTAASGGVNARRAEGRRPFIATLRAVRTREKCSLFCSLLHVRMFTFRCPNLFTFKRPLTHGHQRRMGNTGADRYRRSSSGQNRIPRC